MSPPSCRLRPAVPLDAEAVVPLIHASGPAALEGIFTTGSDRTALGFLYQAFGRSKGEMGYGIHTVAELDGEVAGICAGFGASRNLEFMRVFALQILKFHGLPAAMGVIKRGLQFERMVRGPKRGEFSIVHISVAPKFQGRGIGRLLVQHQIDQARSGGYSRAVLDVAEPNTRAKRLYEQLGFRTAALNQHGIKAREGMPVIPAHYRMELPL